MEHRTTPEGWIKRKEYKRSPIILRKYMFKLENTIYWKYFSIMRPLILFDIQSLNQRRKQCTAKAKHSTLLFNYLKASLGVGSDLFGRISLQEAYLQSNASPFGKFTLQKITSKTCTLQSDNIVSKIQPAIKSIM